MKILYSGLQYDYYDPKKGLSFEHQNFYSSLKQMPGMQFVEHLFDQIVTVGKKKFNGDLLALVKKEKPDLLFAFMGTDELDKGVLDEIKKITTSIAWFADDHWRLHNHSRFWAPHFTWAVTTWSKGPAEYAKYGIKNVIRSQWACNAQVWKPADVKRDIDVSFIGQRNPSRDKMIGSLRTAGIDVYVRGLGWSKGKVPREEMATVLSRSKINLNFNNPIPPFSKKAVGRLLFRRDVNRYVPDFHLLSNARSWWSMQIPQIKARPFELAGCRAFVITGYADDFENYYRENEEMVFYRSPRELVEKIKYYLSRDEERERIAQAAYARTMLEHTYQKRFENLWRNL